MDFYMGKIWAYFELYFEFDRTRWLAASLKRPLEAINFDKLLLLHKYDRTGYGLEPENGLVDAILMFTTRLLDSFGVELNEFVKKPRNTHQAFTLFVRTILAKIFDVIIS